MEKIFLSIKNSYLPALLLASAVWYHYAVYPFAETDAALFHGMFFTFAAAALIFRLCTNRAKSLFLLLWIFIAYLFVNGMKSASVGDLKFFSAFDLLFMLLPLNALFFEFIGDGNVFIRPNFKYICLILVECIIVEKLQQTDFKCLTLNFYYSGCIVWIGVLLILCGKISVTGKIGESGDVYAIMAVFAGLLDYKENADVALYFMIAALILLISAVVSYLYTFFRDPLTGVYGKQSYLRQSRKSFPLKYSLGVVCIDNYDNLLKTCGAFKTDRLVWMVVDKIKSLQPETPVYRYEDDEFILIFKNEDKKQGYEHLEELRRAIAGTTFVLSSKNKIKMTVSAGISEKKRSDADAKVVLERTREAVQRAYKFTQNMTSKA